MIKMMMMIIRKIITIIIIIIIIIIITVKIEVMVTSHYMLKVSTNYPTFLC